MSLDQNTYLGIDFEYLFREWKQMFESQKSIVKDLWAGTTVALVALPLNLALAVSAGVEPGIGITTGIIAGVIGGLFGGQKFAITGPAAAMAVVLIEISQHYGIGAIWLVGLIAGTFQLLAGIFKLGRLISFIPMPVMVGFANAIGMLVFFNAVDDFLGLPSKRIAHPGEVHAASKFIPQFVVDLSDIWHRCVAHQEMNIQAVILGTSAFLIALLLPKLTKAIPGQLVAIIFATTLAGILHFTVPVIGDVAHIPNTLPMPAIPVVPWNDIIVLFPTAITVFMLGSIESLLSASIADGMTGSTRHHSNQELIGQGLANLVVPFFSGIPVTGVIARTAVNIRAGARTRLSAIFHSVVLTCLIFFLAHYAEKIPLAALAAILMLTGLRLIEWDAILQIWRGSRAESAIILATTLTSVAVDLTAGVFVGLVFACALFIKQMSDVYLIPRVVEKPELSIDLPTCKFVTTYVVDGPLFFGAAEKFVENIIILETIKVMILHMKAARVMDLTGVETLLSIQNQLRRHGGRLVLAELADQPVQLLERTSALEKIGRENVYADYRTAILSVNDQLLSESCKSCGNRDGKAPRDCRLHTALLDATSPMATIMEKFRGMPSRPKEADLEWLFAIESVEDIPEILKSTPIEILLKAQNLGLIEDQIPNTPELVVGMCIDNRKSLTIPRDWAYTIRREGANMDGAEFAIALGLSRNINYMALIAHNHCAMANTAQQRDNIVDVLSTRYGWDRPKALSFFDSHARSREIGNEIDFVLQEAKRLATLFPGLVIVPILFRLEDDRLYLIYDWLVEHAPNDPIMMRMKLRDTGGFQPLPAEPSN